MKPNFRPIDESVKVPPAVLAAAQLSEELMQQANGKTEVSEEPTPAGNDGDAGTTAQSENTFQAPSPEAETVTPEVTETRSEQHVDEQSWEHRYKSMKGRFDRASAQIAAMSDQIQSLQNVIASMQVQAPSPSISDAEIDVPRLITPEEENDYGQDFLNVVGKKAQEEVLRVSKKYEAKIAELEEKLKGVGGYVQQDARARLEQTMDSSVPDWRDINFNPDFIQWLKLPDPYSGAIRHEMLKEAYARNDAARVANFFKGFLAEEAAVAPATGDKGRSEPAPAKPSLEDFAAPGRAKTAAASGAPAEKPYFTRAEIAKFYQDSAAGKYRGKEAEMNRIEQQIFDAEREGRIR